MPEWLMIILFLVGYVALYDGYKSNQQMEKGTSNSPIHRSAFSDERLRVNRKIFI